MYKRCALYKRCRVSIWYVTVQIKQYKLKYCHVFILFLAHTQAPTAWTATVKKQGSGHGKIQVRRYVQKSFAIYANTNRPVLYFPQDVFYLGPSQTLYILARYGPMEADYMFHCHNTVHEDNAMMTAFGKEIMCKTDEVRNTCYQSPIWIDLIIQTITFSRLNYLW